MDESIVGKVLVVGIVLIAIAIIRALMTSKSEGARRIRVALFGLFLLGVVAAIFAAGGPVAVITTAAVLGVLYWIAQGFKK